MKVYTNFEEIWQDYPKTCAVHLETYYGDTLRLAVTDDISGFGTKNWGVDWAMSNWTLVPIDFKDKWFFDIFRQSNLRGISIYISHKISSNIYKKISFSKLEHLEKLRFNKNITDEEPQILTIPALSRLNTLMLSGWAGVEWAGKLEVLHYLHLSRQETLTLPAMLDELNPAKLTQLYLESIKDLQFHTNIEKPKGRAKKAVVIPPFEGFKVFENITYFGLYNNKIYALPFQLTDFPKLQSLDLSSNKLTTFPKEILYLPALTKLELKGTTIVKNKDVKGGSELLKLKKDFETKKIAHTDRELLLQILAEGEQVGKDLDLAELFRLSTLTTHTGILRRIASLSEKAHTQNPFEHTPDIAHIAVVGKTPAMTFESVKDFFSSYNILITNKITDKTQIVCIGEKPLPAQIELLAQRKLPLALPTQLKAHMAKLETPYLTESEEDIIKNLETLLLSEDEHNIVLALQMMKNGGLPELFFEFLCLQCARNQWSCKKELMSILEKYATPSQFISLKKVSSIIGRRTNYLRDFINLPDFDTERMVKCALRFYTPHKSGRQHDYFLYTLKGAIWHTTAEALELLLDHYLQVDGTLIMENTSMALANIPPTLSQNPRIKKMMVLETLLKRNTAKVINSLPNLTEIEILFHLPMHLEKAEELVYMQEKLAKYQTSFPKKTIVLTLYGGDLSSY